MYFLNVLIDVNYCALNGSDILLAENTYIHSPILPAILGYEVVGKLLQVGEEAKKEGFRVGDQVVALNRERWGGLAEQCSAETGDIWKIPTSLKMVDVACLMNSYMKALIGLQQQANLEEDEIVLVNVGLGGVGLAAVDLASNVFRSQVIAVTLSEDRSNITREKGAFASLKFDERKLMKQIVSVAAERDIAGVFEGVDGEHFKKILDRFTDIYKPEFQREMLRDDNFSVLVQHLSREGRVIIAGIAPTRNDEQSKSSIFTPSSIDIRQYRKKDHKSYHEAGEEVLEYFEEGLISPSNSLVTGLNRVNEAIKFMSELKNFGKVVIDLKNRDAGTKVKK
ncbi:quinone oxidoreductase-like protein 2 isoform X2 [Venturia canescens]|uniref:quinone oxidoreductase-like protein 2 isoform X2 n=1 Tax=Venturia canescens TaxID=32260 RepID=UPI001C9D38C6|nr:quinone oxidoreductase-like protein 2 isoform X2 [Venturia canescens]